MSHDCLHCRHCTECRKSKSGVRVYFLDDDPTFPAHRKVEYPGATRTSVNPNTGALTVEEKRDNEPPVPVAVFPAGQWVRAERID